MKITYWLIAIIIVFGSFTCLLTNDASAAEVPGKCTNVRAYVVFGYITLGGDFPSNHVESDVQGLHIYRGTDPSNLTLHYTLEAYVNTVRWFLYQDQSFDNGIRYYYAVAAYNSDGDGILSDIVNITSYGAPPAPQNFQLDSSYGQVSLSWDVPVSDGGKPIENYSVFKGGPGDDPIWLCNTTGCSFVDTNVNYEQYAYHYQVCAVNEDGAGKRTNVLTAYMLEPEITGKVIDTEMAPVSGAKVELDGNVTTMVTDANGSFSMETVPGNHTLRVWLEDKLLYSTNVSQPWDSYDVGTISIEPRAEDQGDDANDDGPGLLPIVGIAVIVLAGIAIAAFVMKKKKG